jgi:hypothetical protein
MLDGVVFSCQQIGVNTFYKCIEFQVNSIDTCWEILKVLTPFCWQEKTTLSSILFELFPFLAHLTQRVSWAIAITWRPSSYKMLDGVVFSCQQIGVNTFYKCIEFQVNSFDSYWEILIILKKYKCWPQSVDKRRQLHPAFYLSYSPFLT